MIFCLRIFGPVKRGAMARAISESRSFAWEAGIFLVTAVAYVAWAAVNHSTELYGDEPRYMQYAVNLTHGYYVSDDNPDFINGPGYPFVLYPFVAADVSLMWARALNACFIGLGAALLFHMVRGYAGFGWALASASWLVLHSDTWVNAKDIVTEAMTTCIIIVFSWCFCRALKAERRVWAWCVLCSLVLAWLAMTRVMFGHVITVMLLGSLGLSLFWKSLRPVLLRTAAITALAFALCLPYLAYTKAKTGSLLRWSTNSGELFYWLTTTNVPRGNGQWYTYDEGMTLPGLAPYHKEFLERVTKLPVLEREEAFREKGWENVRTSSPVRLLYNWVSNVFRLLVGYPTAFKNEGITTVLVSCFNIPLLVLVLAAVALAIRRPKRVPVELAVLFVFAAIYLGGSTLATARSRYSIVMMPVLLLTTATMLKRNVRVEVLPD